MRHAPQAFVAGCCKTELSSKVVAGVEQNIAGVLAAAADGIGVCGRKLLRDGVVVPEPAAGARFQHIGREVTCPCQKGFCQSVRRELF